MKSFGFKFKLFTGQALAFKGFGNLLTFKLNKRFKTELATDKGNSKGLGKCFSKGSDQGKSTDFTRCKLDIKLTSYSFLFCFFTICHILISTPSQASEQLENVQTFEEDGIRYENTVIPPDINVALKQWKKQYPLYCIAIFDGNETKTKCFVMRPK